MADVTSPAGKPTSEDTSVFAGVVQYVRTLFRGRDADATLRESLEEFIEDHDSGAQALRDEERDMLINILKFGDLRVEDVMVPRADIQSVEENETLEGLLAVLTEAAHSRLPVYRDTLDDPIGMVHIKDVVRLLAQQRNANGHSAPSQDPVAQIRREVLFVPPSMPVVDLFLKMQATHIHMALVIDEYGGTDGLVTIEDLVEEIVGEIEDEHDTDTSPHLKVRSEGGYTADARVEIKDLEEILDVDFLPDDQEEDIDTLGGLVFSLVGRVPQRGELVSHPLGFDFEVMDADPRRIKRLRIIDNRSSQDTAPIPSRQQDEEGA